MLFRNVVNWWMRPRTTCFCPRNGWTCRARGPDLANLSDMGRCSMRVSLRVYFHVLKSSETLDFTSLSSGKYPWKTTYDVCFAKPTFVLFRSNFSIKSIFLVVFIVVNWLISLVISVGGWCSGDAINSVERMEPRTGEWKCVSSMSKRRLYTG